MNKNVVVLFGGDSDERFVSVASAQAIAQALGTATLWFWHHQGSVYQVSLDELLAHENPYHKEFTPSNKALFASISEAISSPQSANSIFLLGVHGGTGENGELQAMLEAARRPFTGSGAQASKIAFDKIDTKAALADYPIKLAPHAIISTTSTTEVEHALSQFLAKYGEAIVKPRQGGSSLGCFFLHSLDQVKNVASQIISLTPRPCLIEKIIAGREFTVGVIEDDHGPKALPPTEIVVDKHRVFDYDGKYLGTGTKEITPAELDDVHVREAQRIAIAAHVALKLYGYSRADMILSKDGMYFLETNTLPGLTKNSLVPQQLAASGISMREFLWTQLQLALKRT